VWIYKHLSLEKPGHFVYVVRGTFLFQSSIAMESRKTVIVDCMQYTTDAWETTGPLNNL
jgi:hypothetical protein